MPHYIRLLLKMDKDSETEQLKTHKLQHPDSQNAFLPGSKSRQSELFQFMRVGTVLRQHKAQREGGAWGSNGNQRRDTQGELDRSSKNS